MTKKIYIISAFIALCLAGCATYLPNDQLAFLVKESPLVSCGELSQHGKITEWNGQPFTGRTVQYMWGFELALYRDGRRVPNKRIPWGVTTDFLPDRETHHELYYAAFRAYARSDWGFAHDEYVRIIKYGYGNIEDVPKLIRGLEYHGDVTPGEPVVCSRDHCLEALELITGAKPGLNASDWKKWWEDHQKKEH